MAEESLLAIERVEEINRSKRVQAAYMPLLVEPVDHTFSPSLLSKTTGTTLTSCKKSDSFPTAKPQSPTLPKTPILEKSSQRKVLGVEIANAIKNNEAILNEVIQILIRNIDVKTNAMTNLMKEDEKRLDDLLTTLAKKEGIGTAKIIMNILSSSTAITIGTLLLASKDVAIGAACPPLLIASGISNLVINEVLPREYCSEKIASYFTSNAQERKNLADNIDITMSLANIVLTVGTSIATGSVITKMANSSWVVSFVQTTLELAKNTINFISNKNEGEYSLLQSKKTHSDHEYTLAGQDLQGSQDEMYSAAKFMEVFHRTCQSVFLGLKDLSRTSIQ